ncbi:MAG: thioesterase family protein [Planctomycetaceae bacterium]
MSHFQTTRRVQFFETDMAGIVHFANFYRWMEEAEHEFYRASGLSIMRRMDDGRYIGWPRVSASCNFRAPARYEDLITVELTIERIGMKSICYVATFRCGDQELAQGRMKTACCLCGEDGKLESIVIPDDYLRLLPNVEESHARCQN